MAEEPKGPRGLAEMAKGMAMATRVGVLFTSEIIGGFAVGYLLDRWLHTRIIMMIVFTMLGVVGAFVQLNQILNQEK